MRRSPMAASACGRTASPRSATARARFCTAATGSGPGRVVNAELTGAMNRMLSGVIDHGTGRAAALPRPAAGKTGTTQDYRDAWFVGYTADLVAGVWFGNDDNRPMRKVTGGSLPAEAWRRFMLAATREMPVRPLPDTAPAPQQVAAAGAVNGRRRVAQPPPRSVPPPAGGSRPPARPELLPAQQRTLRARTPRSRSLPCARGKEAG